MTQYISVNDTVYVRSAGENYSVGIGWSFVADGVAVTESLDMVVGDSRDANSHDSVSVSESVSGSVTSFMKVAGDIPVREGSISGVYLLTGSIFNKLPVRGISANGAGVASGYVPTRSSSAELEGYTAGIITGELPVRTCDISGANQQIDGLLPTRALVSTGYQSNISVASYIPVRTLIASDNGAGYATVTGRLPVRTLVTTGYEAITGSVAGNIPVRTGSITAESTYSITVAGLIPIRTIESDGVYGTNSVAGYIPPRTFSVYLESTVTGDYILRYVRP